MNPWVEKISWSRKWQPTPVFLAGKSHGHRSLVGSSPWGHKESDTTEQLNNNVLYLKEVKTDENKTYGRVTRKVIHFQITSDERIDEGSRAVFSGRTEALRDTSALKHPKACPGRKRFGSALQSCRGQNK